MYRVRRLLGLSLLSLAVGLVAYVGAAHAAAVPSKWQFVDVTLLADENPPALVVGGDLPTDVKLPAHVQLPVPKNAQVQWAGEVLGGDPSKDISVVPSSSIEGTYSVYSFQLTEARTAQIETVLPGAIITDGSLLRTSLTWPSPQDAARVRLSVRLPKTARIAEAADGATLVTDDPTGNYYSRTFNDVKAGSPVSLTFAYNLVTSTTGSASTDSRPSTTTILLYTALAVAVAVLVTLLLLARRGPAADSGDDSDADDSMGIDADGDAENDPTAEADEDVASADKSD